MNQTESRLSSSVVAAMRELYGVELPAEKVPVSVTRKDMKGDYTVVVFGLAKVAKLNPEATGAALGEWLLAHEPLCAECQTIKGFLNITLSRRHWAEVVERAANDADYGFRKAEADAPVTMIEYASPNTNKPLHLGHVRNVLLGSSLARIMAVNGLRVVKTNIVNDRGIHICKSMLAWQKWGNGATPASTGIKGDHLVGDYYVRFDQEYKAELEALKSSGKTQEEAEASSSLMAEAREMLRKWEAGDAQVRKLWEMMNGWVYEGFDVTYNTLGIDFDKIYYESQTYQEGKELVERGLAEGKFYRRDDGSVWADLRPDGLDEKLLLRSDGTSVYMTQDIGTARIRHDDFHIDRMIYVVGNEQNYHFQVLSLLLDRLGFEWGRSLVHFSYGMVELPNGRMKSREGTVVDADELVAGMVDQAREMSKTVGKLEGLSSDEAEDVYRILALGALKYFILKVDPKKNMTFNPAESIDFNGNTGPFVQYSYARARSVLRKAHEAGHEAPKTLVEAKLGDYELAVIALVEQLPVVVAQAVEALSPALIANYAYDLAKTFNQFYHDCPILREDDDEVRGNRLLLTEVVTRCLRNALYTLGIEVPERM